MVVIGIMVFSFTPVFGAPPKVDQNVYTWTDKVYIRITALDFNFDRFLIDEIGNSASNPVKISTRGFSLDQYKLVETGPNTGIFVGEVILTGFCHDADGDKSTGGGSGDKCPKGSDTNPRTSGSGPTDGFLQSDDDDGITVSFEYSEDETVVMSGIIRWNIGEVQWLEASYPASGTGVIRIIDPDMNLNPEAVDNFDVDVWSDSDAGGIDLTVTETNEETGIFEGTVFFTTTDESSGHRLRVSEGDTITAEYEDNTLPDPYTTADELDIQGTSQIGIPTLNSANGQTKPEPSESKAKIPDWIRNNAKWWSEETISDNDFTSGIQFMIKEKIMVIPDLPEDTQMELKDEKRAMGLEREQQVPDWVRHNAGWWADGLISDDDFVSGIKYLVEQGIIRV